FEGCGDFTGLHRLAGKVGSDQSCEDFFRFETEMELVLLDSLSQLVAEALAFDEHADQAALDGFGGAADELGLNLHFAAAFGGCFAEGCAKNGLIEPKLLGDSGGPFGAEKAVWNLLNVGQQEIHGVAFAFTGGQV